MVFSLLFSCVDCPWTPTAFPGWDTGLLVTMLCWFRNTEMIDTVTQSMATVLGLVLLTSILVLQSNLIARAAAHMDFQGHHQLPKDFSLLDT